MRPVLPIDPVGVAEAQVGFVYKRGGLQRMFGTFSSQIMLRQTVEFGFNHRNQFFQGRLIALIPSKEPLSHILWRRQRHQRSPVTGLVSAVNANIFLFNSPRSTLSCSR